MREQLQTASEKKSLGVLPPVNIVGEKAFYIPETPKTENVKPTLLQGDLPKSSPAKGSD